MLGSGGDDTDLVETMAKKRTTNRDVASGKFVVSKPQKSRGGVENWTISPRDNKEKSMTVTTSKSSVLTLDKIARKHSKALKRLADK